MKNSFTYRQTSLSETLDPHVYIDLYAQVKDSIHTYKFSTNIKNSGYIQAKKILLRKTLDICLESYMNSKRGVIIYTSPPSTMYARGEKKVDSMFDLLHEASLRLLELVQKIPNLHIHTQSIFGISEKYLRGKRAQHIDGSRRSRIKNLNTRYFISIKHTFYIFYYIHIRKIQHFSYILIDDVSSTGATLFACKDTVLRNMSLIHRKNPHISYDVKIFSLCH